ncbi:MAG: hypothetical protein ABI743_06025, partial [bacterium]
NCIAWAVGDPTVWWDCFPVGVHYWPAGVERSERLSCLTAVFESQGFGVCVSEEYESGFQKIVLYESEGDWTHVARQLPSGSWWDIEHRRPEDLSGPLYGRPVLFMKRPLT